MIRIIPKSIAGRTTLVLIGGLLLVLALATIVWWMGLFAFSDDTRGPRFIERVVTVVRLMDHLPRESRLAAVGAWTEDDFRVQWTERRPTIAATHRSRRSRWGTRHLSRSIGRPGITIDFMGYAEDGRYRSEDSAIVLFRLSWRQCFQISGNQTGYGRHKSHHGSHHAKPKGHRYDVRIR